jgi:predicted nucleotidyltransferase
MAAESFLVEALSGLVAEFNRRGVEYALAGGWAYSALIEPRATTDIDLLILIDRPSPNTIQELLSSVFGSTVVHPAPMRFHGISIWRAVGMLQEQEIVVDLLLADSEYLRTALTRRQSIPFGALQVPILTLEDLILLKTLAGRLQDLADLEKIQSRREDLRVDWAYVTEWKAKLGLKPSL